jgi:aspartate carbamoyltransferase catalytic subunit
MADELGDAPGEYLSRYGLTDERLALAAPHAVVLHPGPMNRGVEIADSVADGERSLIRRQVANGVAVRMAVLELLVA